MTTIKLIILIAVCLAVVLWAVTDWPEPPEELYEHLTKEEAEELSWLYARREYENLKPSEQARMQELLGKSGAE